MYVCAFIGVFSLNYDKKNATWIIVIVKIKKRVYMYIYIQIYFKIHIYFNNKSYSNAVGVGTWDMKHIASHFPQKRR